MIIKLCSIKKIDRSILIYETLSFTLKHRRDKSNKIQQVVPD